MLPIKWYHCLCPCVTMKSGTFNSHSTSGMWYVLSTVCLHGCLRLWACLSVATVWTFFVVFGVFEIAYFLIFHINCLLLLDAGRRPLRSDSNELRNLLVPCTHSKLGDRSFSVAGPRL